MTKPICQIHLHRTFGFFFRRVRGKGMAIDQAAQELLAVTCDGGVARARRVVERVLSHFPWASTREEVWCGVHPLLDASVQNLQAKVWTLQVAPARAPEVLRTLMPIARQLGVSVAVPYFNFFVDAARDLAEREAYPEKTVAKYDPHWNDALDVPSAKKKLYEGLAALFAPFGFEQHEGSVDLFSMMRPLDEGRSFQRLYVSQAYGMGFEVCSGLMRDIAVRVFDFPEARLSNSPVARVSLGELRERSDTLWVGDGADSCWATDELVRAALDDAQRLMVPMIPQLSTAKGIYDWYFDPAWAELNRRSLSDWNSRVLNQTKPMLNDDAMLMARVLPDDAYMALLDDWEKNLRVDPKPNVGATRCLKSAAAYRQMPQLPDTAI